MVSDASDLIFYQSYLTRHSMEHQEGKKKEELQDTVDICVLTPSILEEEHESNECYTDGKFPFDA